LPSGGGAHSLTVSVSSPLKDVTALTVTVAGQWTCATRVRVRHSSNHPRKQQQPGADAGGLHDHFTPVLSAVAGNTTNVAFLLPTGDSRGKSVVAVCT
jgi:hypothetical protein